MPVSTSMTSPAPRVYAARIAWMEDLGVDGVSPSFTSLPAAVVQSPELMVLSLT